MPHSHRPLVLILRRLCHLIPNASTAHEGPSHMEDAMAVSIYDYDIRYG